MKKLVSLLFIAVVLTACSTSPNSLSVETDDTTLTTKVDTTLADGWLIVTTSYKIGPQIIRKDSLLMEDTDTLFYAVTLKDKEKIIINR